LATTNKLDTIDVSLRRPGRFDNEIEIQIPNQQARYEVHQTGSSFFIKNKSFFFYLVKLFLFVQDTKNCFEKNEA
jgi:SpoVK/Ycf46/Vps4 family AAA+-type ATPase